MATHPQQRPRVCIAQGELHSLERETKHRFGEPNYCSEGMTEKMPSPAVTAEVTH